MAAINKSRAAGLTISQLSRATGVNAETIRYYERIGVLAPPPRSRGGHRMYGVETRQRLAFVRRARALGFSIADIRALLALSRAGGSCARVQRIAGAHLADVQARLSDLARLERILADTVARCSGGVATACPVLDMLDAGERPAS